jgi:hypothetical protein
VAIRVVVARSAGLDIGKASLVACVQVPDESGGWLVVSRKFATMTGVACQRDGTTSLPRVWDHLALTATMGRTDRDSKQHAGGRLEPRRYCPTAGNS